MHAEINGNEIVQERSPRYAFLETMNSTINNFAQLDLETNGDKFNDCIGENNGLKFSALYTFMPLDATLNAFLGRKTMKESITHASNWKSSVKMSFKKTMTSKGNLGANSVVRV